jgi:predicted Zn-dependent peptidase
VLEFLTDMLSEPTFQLAPEQTSILNKIRMRAEAANRVV